SQIGCDKEANMPAQGRRIVETWLKGVGVSRENDGGAWRPTFITQDQIDDLVNAIDQRDYELRQTIKATSQDWINLHHEVRGLGVAHTRLIRRHKRKVADCDYLKGLLHQFVCGCADRAVRCPKMLAIMKAAVHNDNHQPIEQGGRV